MAGKADTEEKKSRGLNEAYFYEAFASHYLTDLFSSGHMRPPRRKFHTTDVNMTALGGAKSNLLSETPIWDYHCRYMHDDDSASGLLVRNAKGDQWIQYGDKQLLEPGNVLNRTKVTECLQASVDELWTLGFNYKGGADDPLPSPNDFAAFKLSPKPMLSYNDPDGWIKAWNGYDQHNIAPLWRAESPDEPATKKWTYRKDLNDHSKFTRVEGSPKGEWALLGGVNATDESYAIRDAAFRGEGQFMEAKAFGSFLETGGFLQVQELMVDKKARRCLNVWGCTSVKFRRNDNICFTVRNRLIDFDAKAPNYDPKSLHWASWWDGETTNMYHFHQTDSGKGDMVLTVYPLTDPMSSEDTQIVDYNPAKSWNFSIDASVITETKIPVSPSSGLRFILGNFEKGKKSKAPDLATLVFAANGSAQLFVGTVRDGKYQQLGASDSVTLKADALHFLKKTSGASGQPDSVALVSASKSGSQVNIDVKIFSVDTTVQVKSLNAVQIPYNGPLEDVSVMVSLPIISMWGFLLTTYRSGMLWELTNQPSLPQQVPAPDQTQSSPSIHPTALPCHTPAIQRHQEKPVHSSAIISQLYSPLPKPALTSSLLTLTNSQRKITFSHLRLTSPTPMPPPSQRHRSALNALRARSETLLRPTPSPAHTSPSSGSDAPRRMTHAALWRSSVFSASSVFDISVHGINRTRATSALGDWQDRYLILVKRVLVQDEALTWIGVMDSWLGVQGSTRNLPTPISRLRREASRRLVSVLATRASLSMVAGTKVSERHNSSRIEITYESSRLLTSVCRGIYFVRSNTCRCLYAHAFWESSFEKRARDHIK